PLGRRTTVRSARARHRSSADLACDDWASIMAMHSGRLCDQCRGLAGGVASRGGAFSCLHAYCAVDRAADGGADLARAACGLRLSAVQLVYAARLAVRLCDASESVRLRNTGFARPACA